MRIIRSYNTFINENVQVQPVENTQVEPQVEELPQEVNLTPPVEQNDSNSTISKINKIVDYTSIKPGLLKENIKGIVDDAVLNNYYGICVNPEFVDYVVYQLEDKKIKVISTLDFPDGKMNSNDRLSEVIKVISDGADEIDLSIDIEEFKKSYLVKEEDKKNSDYLTIEDDIKQISDECHKNGVVLKVILETGILSYDELKDLCRIVSKANVDFVQTSSGMKEIGYEIDKVKELRRLLPDHIKLKASGGVRTIQQANELYPFVDRIGTSIILK